MANYDVKPLSKFGGNQKKRRNCKLHPLSVSWGIPICKAGNQGVIVEFERISIVCVLALLTSVLNVWFRPVIEFTYSDAIHEKIAVHAISVFQEKFDVEFTRQSVNFSILFCPRLVCTPQQRVMRAY